MSYMKSVFEDGIYKIAGKTGYGSVSVADVWNGLCAQVSCPWEHFLSLGDLAEETGYDFLDLVDQYCQVRLEAEADGEPFDWEMFCGVTQELDW